MVWICLGLAATLIGAGAWMTREPAPPFKFLNGYQVVERKSSDDGKLRILILKADANEVWQKVRKEFSGTPVFMSSGVVSFGGAATMYMTLGTQDGIIKVSNDLDFANEGFGTTIQRQDLRPGYCAVAFSRPKTIFDQALDWMRKLFKVSPPAKKKASEQTIHV